MSLRSPTDNENKTASGPTHVMLSAAKHLLFPGKKADSSAPPQNDIQRSTQSIQAIFERVHKEPSAAEPQPNLGISRAKTRRPQSSKFRNESHSKGYCLSSLNLATLRLGERNLRRRVRSASRSFAQATQITNYSSTKRTGFRH